MIKKSIVILIIIFSLLSLVFAQDYKLGLDIKESFESSEPITFKVNIFDSENNLVNDQLKIEIQDPEKGTFIEKTINSGEVVSLTLNNPRAGYWSITAIYQNSVVKEFFNIKTNEEIKFEIQEDELIIKNIGNKRYANTIDIIIGESYTQKNVELEIGEETSFRLVAPDGTYSIKVTDGTTTFSKTNVQLTGISGNVIGIMDKSIEDNNPGITGGPRGDETFYNSVRSKTFVWIFIMVIVGAAILVSIERRYRKRI